MATKTIMWPDGSIATLIYNGHGSGTITVQSELNNHYEARSAQITVRTTDGSDIERTVTIVQAAKVRIDISTAIVTAPTQTYSGSAISPTPTVTLNGETVPSSGYDIAYSDNTNAGTATITVTGKGDYTGTAIGTFTIAKANPTYTAPTARTGLTYSGSPQYLVMAGSTSHGTIQYSSNGTTWSTTRPSSTNAGSYTTYWRLVGDSNHNDVASTSLSTTIAKASRTLSFADSYVVLDTSSNVTKTATPSAGSGDGTITYSISSTTYATINSSSGKVTSKTSDGSAVVTATIAEGTNYLSATASYNLYVFATTHNYDYNGSYRSVTLPPGTYQFQCWGAQGGSNAVYSTYGIYAVAGGKGGYSIGQLTVAQATNVRVYVGGQGSSSAGGFNGGGNTSGSSTYNNDNYQGVSRMAGGGGATDIRLSDGALLSRMIVAGGGGGGACSYYKETTTVTTWEPYTCSSSPTKEWTYQSSGTTVYVREYIYTGWAVGDYIRLKLISGGGNRATQVQYLNIRSVKVTSSYSYDTVPDSTPGIILQIIDTRGYKDATVNIEKQVQTSSTVESNDPGGGIIGGGTTGGGTNGGKQTSAGPGGSFGQGANQTATNYRFCSGAGGGGWYGGGCTYSDSDVLQNQFNGGGSGWVNTAASASNRPSGYTGLQLDSGETKGGNTSFPAPGGGNETGHAGNGYARITRLS